MHKKAKLHMKNKKGNIGGPLRLRMPSDGSLQESRVCGGRGGGWVFKECANRKLHSTRVKLDFQIQGTTQSITVSGKLGRLQGGNNFLMEVAAENMQSGVNKAKRICLCT